MNDKCSKEHTKDKPEISLSVLRGYQPEKNRIDKENPPKQGSVFGNDPWKHRSKGMVCETCMWHVNFRCRKHAPTLNGYPAVFLNDWCGDHKIDKIKMGGK